MFRVKRNAVSIVTRELRQLGLNRNTRGLIEVAHRHDIESVACECYSLVHRELARNLTNGPSPARRGLD